MSLFEAPKNKHLEEFEDDEPITAPRRRNTLAAVGAGLSFVPLVGLVLSVFGLRSSKTRDGLGRKTALVGIALSVVLSGAEIYVGTTAPMFDSGCLGASSPASQLQAIQSAPTGDVSVLAAELNSIHFGLSTAAGEADSAEVRTKLQSVSDDVKALSADLTNALRSGDTSRLVDDEAKLQSDGDAADSYCHSL
jgi:hypothetical protein